MFWFLVLSILTTINFFIWIYHLYFFKNRLKIVNELLPNCVVDLLYPITNNELKLIQSNIELFEIENSNINALENLKVKFEEIISQNIKFNKELNNTIQSKEIEKVSINIFINILKKFYFYFKNQKQNENNDLKKIYNIIENLIKRKKLSEKLKLKFQICNLIGSDGVLVMELVRINSDDFIASSIFGELVNEMIDYNEFTKTKKFCFFKVFFFNINILFRKYELDENRNYIKNFQFFK